MKAYDIAETYLTVLKEKGWENCANEIQSKFDNRLAKQIVNDLQTVYLKDFVYSANLPPLYTYEDTPQREVPIAFKLFLTNSSWSWFITEGERRDDDFLMFGLVDGYDKEFGYVSLNEMAAIRNSLGLAIEVDLHFGEHFLQEAIDKTL